MIALIVLLINPLNVPQAQLRNCISDLEIPQKLICCPQDYQPIFAEEWKCQRVALESWER